MKKLLAILLAILCMSTLFVGCGDKEKTTKEEKKQVEEVKKESEFLPYGLEFGMSYDNAKKAHKDLPELEDASANDGYYCGIEFDDEAYIEIFELSDGDPYFEDEGVMTNFSYSFNENKKLYEFYAMADMKDREKALEHLKQLGEFFEKKTGIECDGLSDGEATWEIDDNVIQIVGQSTEDGALIMVIIHNKTYELS